VNIDSLVKTATACKTMARNHAKKQLRTIVDEWDRRDATAKHKFTPYRSLNVDGKLYELYKQKKATGLVECDHAIPMNVLTDKILDLREITVATLVPILRKSIPVLLTESEHARLSSLGLASEMPDGWDWETGDPFARYNAARIHQVFNEDYVGSKPEPKPAEPPTSSPKPMKWTTDESSILRLPVSDPHCSELLTKFLNVRKQARQKALATGRFNKKIFFEECSAGGVPSAFNKLNQGYKSDGFYIAAKADDHNFEWGTVSDRVRMVVETFGDEGIEFMGLTELKGNRVIKSIKFLPVDEGWEAEFSFYD